MLSSHILPEIQTICDNVQIINQGQLVFSDSIDQLNQQMQTYSIVMSCYHSIDIQLISDLEIVEFVEQIKTDDMDKKSILIHCVQNNIKDEDRSANQSYETVSRLSQRLVSMAEQQQWGLYEIFAKKRSLEDIFMSLTDVESVSSNRSEQALQQEERID